MSNLNMVLSYLDEFKQTFRIKGKISNLKIQLKRSRKYVLNKQIDFDIQVTVTNFINKKEVLLIKEFESLEDEMFDELRFEIRLNDDGY